MGLAEKIKKAVQNLTVVNKILNESKADLDEALQLKEEALAAKRFAIKVMNQTQRVLDMLATTKDLQNTTDFTIKVTTKVIADATDIINQIKEKIRTTNIDLQAAQSNVTRIEGERDKVKEAFRINKE